LIAAVAAEERATPGGGEEAIPDGGERLQAATAAVRSCGRSKGLRPNFIKEEEKVFYKSATAWQKTAEVAELKKNLGEHLAKENTSQVRTTLREGLGALEEPTETQ
jgi:hypothetical protein